MSKATSAMPAIESEPRDDRTLSPATSRRRWLVLALLLTITIINFIDRQTVSVLAPVLRQILHLSNEQYGRIVAAFQFGMMTGEFPMGWLMDRLGVRLGLSGAVLWWSLATGAQAATRSGAVRLHSFLDGDRRVWQLLRRNEGYLSAFCSRGKNPCNWHLQ